MMYEIFERLCKENGVTPYRVGKETHITTSTLTDWKKGRYTPKQDKLMRIADYFGVSVDYLMGKESKKDVDQVFYLDDGSRELVEFLHKNPEHKVLFDASRKVKPGDIKKALKAIGIFIDDE